VLDGTVTDAGTSAALVSAQVSFCTADNRCISTSTGADGMYAYSARRDPI